MFGLDPIPDALLRAAILTPVALIWVVLIVRAIGLRAFSKMTSFDFVVTLATGSLLANAATADGWPKFVQPVAAMLVLLVMQVALVLLRRRSDVAKAALDNVPVLLMRDGAFIDAALHRTRVSRDQVIAKLREANALDLGQVKAVVLETTGDISVLHGDACDPMLLEGLANV